MSKEPQDDAPDGTYPSGGTEYVIFDPEDDIAAPRVWDVGEYCDGDAIIGPKLVTFDRRTILNLWTDFPEKFTDEQIDVLREERPFWYEFFASRLTGLANE
ncbi:DUF7675 family protein [Actinomyces culturomici]|uniref:DUF7675 family protein n=1 Tax=Actinomyces culturomici TaxID=1926276 RepID=UPI000E2072CF|nr:hypothetical protein [Actinomyces culturomici]